MPKVACLGAAVLDRKYTLHAAAVPGTSNPATAATTTAGGVARNVADNLARLGVPTALVCVVGDDSEGEALARALAGRRVNTGAVRRLPARPTDEYLAVLSPDGELVIGVAAMRLVDELGPDDVDRALALRPDWLFVDCNLGAATLAAALGRTHPAGARLAVDAVSVPKVTRLPADLSGVDLLFCTRDEAAGWALAHRHPAAGTPAELAGVVRAAGAATVVVTCGPMPVLLARAEGTLEIPVPAPVLPVLDVTGGGDALVAGTLAGLVSGDPLPEAVASGIRLALAAVRSRRSVAG